MMQEDLLEAFRTPLFFVYISMLLSFCVVSGAELGDRVELEFQAYRLQQYELAGSILGSKSFRVLYEAVSLDANALRKCTVASWRDLATRDLDAILKHSVGALLVILPADYSTLSPNERKQFADLEQKLAHATTELAVYAVRWSDSAAALLSEVATTSPATSGAQQLLNAVTANTFQLSSSSSSAPATISYSPKNVIARLGGSSSSAPTIAFIAHYDTHAAFPDLSIGADSNGSGMVALMELLSVLKRFYERSATRPNYHMLFVWTAAGKHNYQGARAFVEEMYDKFPDDKLELALCLDSIGHGKDLNVHVSKTPSEGTVVDRFVRHLIAAAPNQTVNVVAKKINLNMPQFAWEHERLNVKRLPAVTISHLATPSEEARRSLTDTQVDADAVVRNVRALGEAVLSLVLDMPMKASHKDARVSSDSTILSPDAVSKERIESLLSALASAPRPLSSVTATERTAANLVAYASAFAHTRTKPVQLETTVVTGGVERIVAEKTKPAIFDLFLAGAVLAYLSLLTKVVASSQSIVDRSLTALRKAM